MRDATKWQKSNNKFYEMLIMTKRQRNFFFKELNIGVFGQIVVVTAAAGIYQFTNVLFVAARQS